MPLKGWDDEDEFFTPEDPGDFYPAIPDDPVPDPYANWGGGAGGDGTDGSGDAGASGGMEYWDKILAALSKGAGGAGGGNSLESLMRALGLSGNSGQAGSLLPLLAALMGGGALVNGNNRTSDAAKQIQDAANKANEQGTALIGGARQDFQPYMQAGTNAVGGLSGMVGNNNLADKFGPVAGGPNLADKFKGAQSLAALAVKR